MCVSSKEAFVMVYSVTRCDESMQLPLMAMLQYLISISVLLAPVQPLSSACTPVNSSDEHPHLSPSGLAQCKLLLYGTLVQHYSHTDRPPLLPQHMADIYTAITDLLGNSEVYYTQVSHKKHRFSHLLRFTLS